MYVGDWSGYTCLSLSSCAWTHQQLMKWATWWQNQQNRCAPSEDSDQPGHPPILIRVLAVRMKMQVVWVEVLRPSKSKRVMSTWRKLESLSAQRRLWSDWADAQADLRHRWAHMIFCWSCHEVAQMLLLNFRAQCSKLTMSLVNDSLKFTSSDTQICWNFLLKKCE